LSRVEELGEDYNDDTDDELLDTLGVDSDITSMKHVRTASERNAERTSPEEVAQRKPCEDFDDFRSDFKAIQADIQIGRQTAERFKTSHRIQIDKHDWFILNRHKALVAEVGQGFTPERDERDRRLRVIAIASMR